MTSRNLFSVLSLAILFLVAGVQRGSCQQVDSTAEEKPSAERLIDAINTQAADPSSATSESKFRGRLPRFFSSVVRPEQRMEIYRIQMSYRGRIEELERALMELRAAQTREVEQVLSASQLEQVVAMREQSMRDLRMRTAAGSSASSEGAAIERDN